MRTLLLIAFVAVGGLLAVWTVGRASGGGSAAPTRPVRAPLRRSLHEVTADIFAFEPIFARSHGVDCSYLHGPGHIILCTKPENRTTAFLFRVRPDGKTEAVGAVR